MSVVELSMTTNYVRSWTVLEAVREILQNAFDQQTVNPENTAHIQFEHDGETGTLYITSKLSVLERSSLLLGMTTKADDKHTIGKFGEGYKLALLVLCRLGYKVEIHNYGKKQKWTPFLKMSRAYGSEVLAIKIERFVFTSVPDANLTFQIEGISTDDWHTIQQRTLQLQTILNSEVLQTRWGSVLQNERHKGSVYVNGLFICKQEKLHHGYNFKPEYIQLDRDRSMIRDFDMYWLTSTMWASLWEEHRELVESLVEEGAPEVEYISNMSVNANDSLFQRFIQKYGNGAVPVTNEDQSTAARKAGYRPVVVTSAFYGSITSSAHYAPYYTPRKDNSPQAVLEAYYEKHSGSMDGAADKDFQELVSTASEWVIKE